MKFSFDEELLTLQQKMREFCRTEIAPKAAGLDAASPDQAGAMVRGHLKALGEAGFLGVGFPEDAGGSGGDLVGATMLLQEIGGVCLSTGLAVLGSVGLCARALEQWGQKPGAESLTADLLAGRAVGGCATMETGVSLDAWDLKASGDGGVVSGEKVMVLNASLGGPLICSAVEEGRAALYLLAQGAEGMTVSAPRVLMGCRGVPVADVTMSGAPAGKLSAVNGEDPVAVLRSREHLLLAALAEGVIHGLLVNAGVYARDNKAGQKPLGRHQEISFQLAEIMLFQETARMLISRCVWMMQKGDPEAAVLASCAKCYASESAVKASRAAVQIMGCDGYTAGSYVERCYRDAKILEMLGDPTERHRMYIADNVLENN